MKITLALLLLLVNHANAHAWESDGYSATAGEGESCEPSSLCQKAGQRGVFRCETDGKGYHTVRELALPGTYPACPF